MKIKRLDEIEKKLLAMVQYLPAERDEFLEEQAEFLIKTVKPETPTDTGTLKNKWERTEPKNGQIIVTAHVDYLNHVEYGFRQKRRWVPGAWKGKRFIYDPKAKTGIMLKPKRIKGKKMLRRAVRIVKRSYPKAVREMLNRLLKEGKLK